MIRRPRAILGTALGAHFLHDGLADVVYVLLPVWARELGLSFAQVGLARTAYSGGMATFQIPAGLLADRWGERRLLGAGTAVVGLGFVAAAWVPGFALLALALLAAGLGSGVQHPLASSLVSRAYDEGRRRAALGTYNFAGDVGKAAVPALVGIATAAVGWRAASAATGAVAVLGALALVAVLGRLGVGDPGGTPARAGRAASGAWGILDRRGFVALGVIAMLDNACRTTLLTFLPFVLVGKGLSVAGVGGALALVFAGGAAGKFVCGLLAERIGVIPTVVLTEAATAAGIVAVLAAPLPFALVVLPLLGVALNGTSSALQGTVADLVTPQGRARAYGLYYTLAIGASAVAPTLGGVVSDVAGVPVTLLTGAASALAAIPLCLTLRTAVSAPA